MSEPETPAPKAAKARPHRATSLGFRAPREAALTAALRANLKRRKAAEAPADAKGAADHENAQGDGSDDT